MVSVNLYLSSLSLKTNSNGISKDIFYLYQFLIQFTFLTQQRNRYGFLQPVQGCSQVGWHACDRKIRLG